MINRAWKWLMVCVFRITLIAGAEPQPTLRCNKQLHMYGRQMAQEEIDACQQRAAKSGLQHGTNQSTNAATGAVLGVTLGGAVGASAGVVGDYLE